jgi:DNA-binding CsgD family transcriptional regulator/sugar-specific transcriptional regulator TrmB
MLGGIGVSQAEEAAYRALIRLGGATPAELGCEHLPALARLVEKGLANRFAGRYVPAPPDVAIEALVAQRHEELARARLATSELVEEFRGAPSSRAADVLEVIAGEAAVASRLEQLQRNAVGELLLFGTPPCPDALARGVRTRLVLDGGALQTPGQPAAAEAAAAAGAEVRVTSDLPMTLAIADRRLALTPRSLQQGLGAEALLVQPSGLLEGLAALFETVWQRAIPLSAPAAAGENERRLLMLLASGLKDEAIARQLGIGERTVRRRVAALADRVGARTRFQLGVQAARRGLL